MRSPGFGDVDLERAILDTADILLHWLDVPGNRQAVAEKRGWDRGAKDGSRSWHEGAYCIEYRYHLRGVTVSMSGDRAPN